VLHVYTLGDFKVVLNGQPLSADAWHRRRATQLFKCVLSSPNCRLMREAAIELFWPESDLDKGTTNLRSLVHAMRRTLDPHGTADPVVFDRAAVGLRTGPDLWVDADAFETALAQARDQADSMARLEQASALYRGAYLPDDLDEVWTESRREHLKRSWIDLKLQLASHYEQLGQTEGALTHLEEVIGEDSSNEPAVQAMMRLLLHLGRPREAAQIFDTMRDVLLDELGVEPTAASAELRRQASARSSQSAPSREPPFRCPYPFPEPARLIGREVDLRRLEQVIERGLTGGQVLMLSGAAGTGKSALVGSLVQTAQDRGVLCLAGASYEDRGAGALAMAPFREALTDYVVWASRLVVDTSLSSAAGRLVQIVRRLGQHLDADSPAAFDISNERTQLFGAILAFLRTVAERMPVLLCLEDLHVADAATLNLMHYLARQTRNSPVVILGTFRTEEARAGDALTQLLGTLGREGLLEQVQLEPLDKHHTARLAALLSERQLSSGADSTVYELTDGNPLVIEQLVHSLREQGRLDELSKAQPNILTPDSRYALVVHQIFGNRLQELSAVARETLEIGAVLGQSFDYATLLAVARPTTEADLLAALDEALRAELLRETASGFAFHHSLLREEVYWSLSRLRRMLLHARAARALEHSGGSALAQRAARLAYHYSEAGKSATLRRKATRYGLLAGRRAAALSSYPEALAQYARVCAILDEHPASAPRRDLLSALLGRGLAERELGMWPECIDTFRRVFALTQNQKQRSEASDAIAYALAQLGEYFSSGVTSVVRMHR
jgi:DNA-binding SARP family transcriptional activator